MSTTIIVRNQDELNEALAADDGQPRTIDIDSPSGVWLTLEATGSATVSATGSATVRAYGSATVSAYGSATVSAYDSATVRAYGSATVSAYGSATVSATGSATVRAYDSATVRAYGSATVSAYDSATVSATGSATVRAYGSATVRAYDSATVRAYGSATVRAYGSATVRAYESATVSATGSATVRAYGSATVSASRFVAVHLFSQRVSLDGDGHVIDVTALDLQDPATWCEYHCATVEDGIAHVYKAVGQDWKSHYGGDYSPGALPEADRWDPQTAFGAGLYFGYTPQHALLNAPTSYENPRLLRCGIRVDEAAIIGNKIKARRVVVGCVEVDADGDPIAAAVEAVES